MGEAFPIRLEPVPIQTPLDVALGWARRGFAVFPCGADKKPLTPHGFKDATADLGKVAGFWQAHPRALVGLPTGAASGLFVIDLDTDRETGEAIGEASLAVLGLSDLINAVPTVATPSGGRHLYFRANGMGCSAGKLGPKIDTRGEGGYVIASGSKSPAGAYRIIAGQIDRETLTDVPESILGHLRGNPRAHRLSIDTGRQIDFPNRGQKADLPEVQAILGFIPPDSGYGVRVAVLMGLHDHFNGSSEGLDLACQWIATGPHYRPDEITRKWASFKSGGGIGWGSVCDMARRNGADLATIARQFRGRMQQDNPGNRAVKLADDAQRTEARKASTRPKWCVDLACNHLETTPEWEGVLAYDEFVGLTMLLKPIPGTTVPRCSFTPRPLSDPDLTAALRWFNRHGFPDATKTAVVDAVFAVAGQTILSPVRHYLESLIWDGTPRVADWLTRYCGADPLALTAKVGQAWLVSAVARALTPGCKADCALVLEGKQGAGKSSILRALGGEWFHDGLSNLHDKDASSGLRGKWIIELPELSAMRRSDTEAVKAFLSRTEERYRPAYARAEVVEPRRCVFAGTTNRTDYLTDDTGGRRFWPVVVGAVNLADLTRDRDQIWAEAVALFQGGAQWWLDRQDEGAAAAVIATRAADDPWAADVLRVVDCLGEVSTRDVFQQIGIGIERQTKPDAMRITGILTRAGWTREGKFTSGANRDLARYVAPQRGRHD